MTAVGKAVGIVAGVVAMGFATAATFGAGAVVLGLTAAQVGSIAAGAAMVASVGGSLLSEKPPAATGAVNQILIGANQPRPYLIGETYYGGNRVHQEGFGGKVSKVNNPYLLLVDVYSGAGPVGGLVMPYLDFVPVTLNGNAATGYAANHLYIYRQSGLSPEPQALSTHWGGAQGWSAQHKLSSYAALSWCLRFDEDGKRFAAGVPQTGATWRGVLAYDPRRDSTYPGGSGPHRWADPSDKVAFAAAKRTWEWTRCPGLHGLRYALGTWDRDESRPDTAYRKTFGIGIPIDGVRVADFVALANVCDANGWHVDGVIVEPAERDDNLKNILSAGGAERCWVGGKLGLKLSAPRVPLDTITEYDLANDDVEVGAMQGWESRLNTIIPKYRSPDHKWEYVPSEPVTIASYLAEDGEEKVEEVQYNLVQSKDQAAQLAAYALLDARELGEIVLNCKPRLRRYGAGDVLIVHLPDDGLVQQPCVVLKRTVDPVAMTVELILRGETPAKHDFALGRTGTAPATPRLTGGDALDAVAIDVPLPWDAITGDKKPDDNADVTGENTAKDTAAIGGRPVGNVLAKLDAVETAVEPIPALAEDVAGLLTGKVDTDKALGELLTGKVDTDKALSKLEGVSADHGAIFSQIDRHEAARDEALLRLLTEGDRTRRVIRDAGVSVDPQSGRVTLYGLEYMSERVSTAEIAIDAVRGLVTTKVGRTEFTAQGERIFAVEQTLSTMEGVSAYGVTVRQARTIAEDSAEAALRGALNADGGRRRQIVQVAEGREEMYALLGGLGEAQATARYQLSVAIGALDARTVRETTARIDGDAVLAKDIRALGVVSDKQTAAIGTLEEASIEAGKGIAGVATTIRQQVVDDEASTEALLRGLIQGDVVGQQRAAQLVQARTELTTGLVAGKESEAASRQSLLVRFRAADARADRETLARIDGDGALARDIRALGVVDSQQAAAIGTLEEASIQAGKGIAGVATTIRQQAAEGEESTEALLRGLVQGDAVGRQRASQLVQARTELTTGLVAGKESEAASRQSLLLRLRGADARAERETLARIDADGALAQDIRALAVVDANQAAAIADVEKIAIAAGASVAGVSTTIRQQAADGDVSDEVLLRALLNGDVTGQKRAAQIVQAQTELTTTLVAGRSSEAFARETLQARLGRAEAATSVVARAVTTGDEATASLVEKVSAKLGDLGDATVQDLIEATVLETGKILARRTVTVDVNGNLVGWSLIGSDAGPGSLNLINTDLKMGTGKVVFDNGSAMRAQGAGFGKNRDLISWFGPSMPLDECTRANAVSFEATDGRAYFGGGLSAGIDKNAVQTSNIAADASVTTGPLSSKGRRRTVVVSYAYSRFAQMNAGTANDRGGSGARVELYRGSVRIGTLDASGEWVRTPYRGSTQPATYTEDLSGALTINDDAGGTTVEYTAKLVTRSLGPGVSGSPVSDAIGQNISIVQTEE